MGCVRTLFLDLLAAPVAPFSKGLSWLETLNAGCWMPFANQPHNAHLSDDPLVFRVFPAFGPYFTRICAKNRLTRIQVPVSCDKTELDIDCGPTDRVRGD